VIFTCAASERVHSTM